jgi:23S rRNA (cytidine1920-2'-O)/16S rRNA (cytidine1409-2'-O)-methyltransferase
MERCNARSLTAAALPFRAELATVDVAFISLRKVLGAVIASLAPSYDVLALVKPQFELGRGRVGKGGVVKDAADRREALVGVGEAALELGSAVLGFHSSGLPGPKGNRETFIWLADPDRAVLRGQGAALLPARTHAAPRSRDATTTVAAGATRDLEQLAREVEP